MNNLKNLLDQQKIQIEKDLKELEHEAFSVKVKLVKLNKMLKNVDKQLEELAK